MNPLSRYPVMFLFFFFNDTATTEIYTLSLHDALPICHETEGLDSDLPLDGAVTLPMQAGESLKDRKSTRLNSSHLVISYAVFCLKKKNASARASGHLGNRLTCQLRFRDSMCWYFLTRT